MSGWTTPFRGETERLRKEIERISKEILLLDRAAAELSARAESLQQIKADALESLNRLSGIAVRVEADFEANVLSEVLPRGLMEVAEKILRDAGAGGLATGELISRVLAERPTSARTSIRSVLAKMRSKRLIRSHDGRSFFLRPRWPE